MPNRSPIAISALYRYPVKGLSPQRLDAAELRPGETLPLDRAYAIEAGGERFDPEAPRHLPKIHFLVLMRNAKLAALETDFDPATHRLTVRRDGKQAVQGLLSTAPGRRSVERFMAAYLGTELRGVPRIVSAPGHSFTDNPNKLVHIVNLATVRDLERVLGRPLDPLRFRANIYVQGARAWEELDWLDKDIAIGAVRLRVFKRTTRCAATDVDPATGARDTAIPAALTRSFGHSDLGIYARVLAGGRIAVGDSLSFVAD